MTVTTQPTAAALVRGWYADPAERYAERYFDGEAWTARAKAGDEEATDALPGDLSGFLPKPHGAPLSVEVIPPLPDIPTATRAPPTEVRTSTSRVPLIAVLGVLGIIGAVIGIGDLVLADTDEELETRSVEETSVLVFGDSNAHGTGEALKRQGYDVYNEAAGFCAIGGGTFLPPLDAPAGCPGPDWKERFRNLVYSIDPDVVVVHVGATDLADRYEYAFDSDEWIDRVLVDAWSDLNDIALSRGAQVIHLTLPYYEPVDSLVVFAGENERVDRLNGIQGEVCHVGATFCILDPGWGRLDHAPDGMHYEPHGYDQVAEFVKLWIGRLDAPL